MRSVCKTALIAVLCLLLCTASALADGGVTVSADFGYDGAVTYLSAMPLRVTLKNDGADAELTVAIDVDRSSSEYDTYEYPVSLASGAEKQLMIPITLNYKQKSYTVRVTGKDGLIASVPITLKKVLAPSTMLVGVLSDSPQTLSYLNIGTANDQLMRGEVWQTITLTQDTFPDSYELMRAFSFLAVDGVLTAVFAIKYQPSRNAEWALRTLKRFHITPVLAVRSGNVTPGLIKRKFGVDARPVYPDVSTRLALAQLAEQRGEQPYVIVCREGLMPLVESVAGSRRAVKAVRTATILGYIGAAVGVALAYYLTSIGNFALLTPIAMVVYQLLWLLPTLLLAGLVKHY